MRISDWSSDVCSSDLDGAATDRHFDRRETFGRHHAPDVGIAGIEDAKVELLPCLHIIGAESAPRLTDNFGREFAAAGRDGTRLHRRPDQRNLCVAALYDHVGYGFPAHGLDWKSAV